MCLGLCRWEPEYTGNTRSTVFVFVVVVVPYRTVAQTGIDIDIDLYVTPSLDLVDAMVLPCWHAMAGEGRVE